MMALTLPKDLDARLEDLARITGQSKAALVNAAVLAHVEDLEVQWERLRKCQNRRHFIPEWAEKRGKKQADIVRDMKLEKSTVYRWFTDNVIPSEKHIVSLSQYLGLKAVIVLFVHPDDAYELYGQK